MALAFKLEQMGDDIAFGCPPQRQIDLGIEPIHQIEGISAFALQSLQDGAFALLAMK